MGDDVTKYFLRIVLFDLVTKTSLARATANAEEDRSLRSAKVSLVYNTVDTENSLNQRYAIQQYLKMIRSIDKMDKTLACTFKVDYRRQYEANSANEH